MFQLKKKDFKNIILERSFQRGDYREYEIEVRVAKDETLKLHQIQFAAKDFNENSILKYSLLNTNNIMFWWNQTGVELNGSKKCWDIN